MSKVKVISTIEIEIENRFKKFIDDDEIEDLVYYVAVASGNCAGFNYSSSLKSIEKIEEDNSKEQLHKSTENE